MDDIPPTVIGNAQAAGQADDENDYPVAILYLPDPGQETGFLTRWVKRQKPPGPPKSTGFKR